MRPLTPTPERGFVVTLDGPAASGKSTTARLAAERLGWLYLDTGAMYRAVALKALRESIPLTDAGRIADAARSCRIDLIPEKNGLRVLLDGGDVTADIRTPEVDRAVGPVCEIAGVRDALVPLQRAFAERGNLITDGRDQGTVVFPDADLKFYFTATLEERAKRRKRDQEARGISVPVERIAEEIEARDLRDSRRQHSPLRPAGDAVTIDTTGLTLDAQVGLILEAVRRKQEERDGA
ncbi:MAG: (d)CMP kinase [bacterium]|nr:(d)CMP kinase [bacterium]